MVGKTAGPYAITPGKLNPPYWQHLGWVIDQAAARGLFVLLVYGSPGRTDNHGAVTRTPAEAYDYGHALGRLYRDKRNLIWSSGIDVNPDDAQRVSPMGMAGWRAMAEGVADGVNGVANFDGQADCTRKPAKPVVNIEPWYEQCRWKTPPVDDWEVRLQAYQSVFAGACGHTYGHYLIWPLDSRGLKNGKRWREALTAPGRMQMRYLRKLMESQPQAGRVPLSHFVIRRDQQPTAALFVTERIAATGGDHGSWAFVYTLIIGQQKRLLIQPAVVRDWPDFKTRCNGAPFSENRRGDWYGILSAEAIMRRRVLDVARMDGKEHPPRPRAARRVVSDTHVDRAQS